MRYLFIITPRVGWPINLSIINYRQPQQASSIAAPPALVLLQLWPSLLRPKQLRQQPRVVHDEPLRAVKPLILAGVRSGLNCSSWRSRCCVAPDPALLLLSPRPSGRRRSRPVPAAGVAPAVSAPRRARLCSPVRRRCAAALLPRKACAGRCRPTSHQRKRPCAQTATLEHQLQRVVRKTVRMKLPSSRSSRAPARPPFTRCPGFGSALGALGITPIPAVVGPSPPGGPALQKGERQVRSAARGVASSPRWRVVAIGPHLSDDGLSGCLTGAPEGADPGGGICHCIRPERERRTCEISLSLWM